jgi:hypothetical protein
MHTPSDIDQSQLATPVQKIYGLLERMDWLMDGQDEESLKKASLVDPELLIKEYCDCGLCVRIRTICHVDLAVSGEPRHVSTHVSGTIAGRERTQLATWCPHRC